ncbi:hypothetical protein [Thermococcus thioreducens]|uniref:Uncharacterized protein n=1 Tax=Thermococcus thioreducens TaxID=277988 RepID=A0A0Q2M285_9EURY|nr:hypothetical protein [Thermococcus thioreducens]ASJ12659.1 hypothetical protein A3L14_07075 [Thermococcus thioreducens]KQH81994.1 hypothetical protein AMR53_07850 [Thermococcus thioreducens]
MEMNKNNLFLYFLEGLLAAITPWTALLIGIVVYVNKSKSPYYSALSTSVAFLLGGVFGALFGYFLLSDTFLAWWTSSEGLTAMLIGIKLWIPALLFGASVIGILRATFQKYKETRRDTNEDNQ